MAGYVPPKSVSAPLSGLHPKQVEWLSQATSFINSLSPQDAVQQYAGFSAAKPHIAKVLGDAAVNYLDSLFHTKLPKPQGGGVGRQGFTLPNPNPLPLFARAFNFIERPLQANEAALTAFMGEPAQEKAQTLFDLANLVKSLGTNRSLFQDVSRFHDASGMSPGKAWQEGIQGQLPRIQGQDVLSAAGWNPQGGVGGVAKALAGFGIDVAADPLTFVPLGDVGKAAKAVSDALGVTEHVAPTLMRVARGIAETPIARTARAIFVQHAHMPEPFRSATLAYERRLRAEHELLDNEIEKAFRQYTKETGKPVTEELLRGITHHIEEIGYAPHLRSQGIEVPKGTTFPPGSPEEKLAQRLQQIKERVTSGEVTRGIRSTSLPGHVYHRRIGGQELRSVTRIPLRVTKALQRHREIRLPIEHANRLAMQGQLGRGLLSPEKLFEDNWFLAEYPRLISSIRAQATHDYLQEILKHSTKVRLSELQRGSIGYRDLERSGLGIYRPETLRFFRAALGPAEALAKEEPHDLPKLLEDITQEATSGWSPADVEWAKRYIGTTKDLVNEMERRISEVASPQYVDRLAKQIWQDEYKNPYAGTILERMRSRGHKIYIDPKTNIAEEIRTNVPMSFRSVQPGKGLPPDQLVEVLREEGWPVKDERDLLQQIRLAEQSAKRKRNMKWQDLIPQAQELANEEAAMVRDDPRYAGMEEALQKMRAILESHHAATGEKRAKDMAEIAADAVRRAEELTKKLHPGIGVRKVDEAYVLPKSVADYLNGWAQRASWKNGLRIGLDAFNGAVKRAWTLNPIYHLKNILYNSLLGDARAMITGQWLPMIREVREKGPLYERAVRAGAVSSWTDRDLQDFRRAGDLAKQALGLSKNEDARLAMAERKLRQILLIGRQDPASLSQRMYQALHDSLWNTDKVLRLTLFKRALDRGLSDEEAARFVNHFLVDYRNLTPAEKDIVQLFFPFYAWQKGNTPLQFEAWLNQTGKQLLPYKLAEELSGQNPRGPTQLQDVALPPNQQGIETLINPSLPSKEVQEILQEPFSGFLFSRSQPLFQTLMGLSGADMRNPWEGPGSYGQVKIYDPTLPEAVQVQPLFGQSGPLVDPRIAFAAGSMPGENLYNTLVGLSNLFNLPLFTETRKAQAENPAASVLAPLLGGYVSTYNPQQQALVNLYLQNKQRQDFSAQIRRMAREGLLQDVTGQ